MAAAGMIKKTGTLSEGKIFQWNINCSDVKSLVPMRSDYFTCEHLPNYEFCLIIDDYVSLAPDNGCLPNTVTVQLRRLHKNPLFVDQGKSCSRKDTDLSREIYVSFVLKADCVLKWSDSISMSGKLIRATFNEVSSIDNLKILCILSTDPPHVIRDSFCKASSLVGKSADCFENSLLKHMEALLNKEILSDITLCVDGMEFNAHRCILASRSAVFAAMFDHNTCELNEKRIIIVDFPSDVIREMLKYIYTGKIGKLSFQQYLYLLSAADKYELLDLKEKCSAYLCANISSDLVVRVLIAADLHQDDELKETAIKKYLRDPLTVMSSEEWIPFMKHNTELANSLLIHLARKSTKWSFLNSWPKIGYKDS